MFLVSEKNFIVCFSDKTDGSLDFYNMPKQMQYEVWKKLLSKLNLDLNLSFPIYLRQVHKTDLVYVSRNLKNEQSIEGDALYTDQKELPIGVFTADCQPILVAGTKVVIAIHAGWRGAMQKIVYKTLLKLANENSLSIPEIKVFMGACIGACCLEVGEEVYNQFVEFDPFYKTFFSFKGNRYNLDLRALNTFQLLDLGVSKSQIFHILDCTKCMNNKYFSYRAIKNRNASQFSWIVKL